MLEVERTSATFPDADLGQDPVADVPCDDVIVEQPGVRFAGAVIDRLGQWHERVALGGGELKPMRDDRHLLERLQQFVGLQFRRQRLDRLIGQQLPLLELFRGTNQMNGGAAPLQTPLVATPLLATGPSTAGTARPSRTTSWLHAHVAHRGLRLLCRAKSILTLLCYSTLTACHGNAPSGDLGNGL